MKKLCEVSALLDGAEFLEVNAKLLRVTPEEFDRRSGSLLRRSRC